jgi:hypothetical protein
MQQILQPDNLSDAYHLQIEAELEARLLLAGGDRSVILATEDVINGKSIIVITEIK